MIIPYIIPNIIHNIIILQQYIGLHNTISHPNSSSALIAAKELFGHGFIGSRQISQGFVGLGISFASQDALNRLGKAPNLRGESLSEEITGSITGFVQENMNNI